MDIVVLETPRLILRPWREDDAASLYKYAKDEAVGSAADWPAHKTVEESREVIRTVFSAPEIYAVVLRETGEPVGCVGLLTGEGGNLPLGEAEAEIGYWLGVPYWGKGLIPEAVCCLLGRAFRCLGLRAVWCCYDADNSRSRRVAAKCGFLFCRSVMSSGRLGQAREVHLACITRSGWERHGGVSRIY